MVALLPLLLVPLVISGFFLVYSLLGWVLEGPSLLRWLDEVWVVSWPTALVQITFCLAVTAWARGRRFAWSHPLCWNGLVNTGLVITLVALNGLIISIH